MIVTISPEPSHGMTFVDVIVGSLSLTVIAVVVAAILGTILAFVLIRWNRRHPPESDRLPPISPLIPDPTKKTS
jgi:ABC-type phosphate transport system permease subunit